MRGPARALDRVLQCLSGDEGVVLGIDAQERDGHGVQGLGAAGGGHVMLKRLEAAERNRDLRVLA